MKPRVIIIGGGFGGLHAAKALGRSDKVNVTVLDRKNHHLFQPLLYQVATASLNPSDIAVPIRQILASDRNIRVHMETAVAVDLANKTVTTEDDVHDYDYLVMACGSTHSYFGHDEWEPLAPGLKTVEQALEIRRRILTAYEQAEKQDDLKAQARLLTFVIIGGGPTGVELAGAVAELSHAIISREFRNIDYKNTRVILIQGDPRLIPAFAPSLSAEAKRALEKKGVEVRLDRIAREITPQGVRLDDEFIETATVLWAAGVNPSPLNKVLGVPLDRQGRIIVDPDLGIPGHPNAFVIGDQAHFDTPKGPLPGLAPVAMQQGDSAAANILRDLDKKPRKPFRYRDKGIMAVIGRSDAVTQFWKFRMTGYLAWVTWLVVHILYLIGFRNRILVIFNWAWSYFTFKRGARLITLHSWTESDPETLPKAKAPASAAAPQPAAQTPGRRPDQPQAREGQRPQPEEAETKA